MLSRTPPPRPRHLQIQISLEPDFGERAARPGSSSRRSSRTHGTRSSGPALLRRSHCSHRTKPRVGPAFSARPDRPRMAPLGQEQNHLPHWGVSSNFKFEDRLNMTQSPEQILSHAFSVWPSFTPLRPRGGGLHLEAAGLRPQAAAHRPSVLHACRGPKALQPFKGNLGQLSAWLWCNPSKSVKGCRGRIP